MIPIGLIQRRAMTTIGPDELTLTTADGYQLAASHFPGRGEQFIVLAGATAVARRYYQRFAGYAASQGVDVLTVDYRGIGGSRHGRMRDLDTDLSHWCTLDLGAAVSWAAERGPTYLVGHSLGGHAIGRLPDPGLLQAAYTCGTGAAWTGWMPRREAIRVRLMWDVVAPLSSAVMGYLPMHAFGMGEDIPLRAYQQWRQWGRLPRYFFDDPDATAITAPFAEVRLPIAAMVVTDDLWAPPRSRDAFFSGYSSAPVDRIDVHPAELSVPRVGHMGYFHSDVGRVLWPQILTWLTVHGLRTVGSRSN
jgi:predicted alpha/beta hydrolase